jgi:hypothetical protein
MAVVVIGIGDWGVIDGIAVDCAVCAEYGPAPFKFIALT